MDTDSEFVTNSKVTCGVFYAPIILLAHACLRMEKTLAWSIHLWAPHFGQPHEEPDAK